MSTCKFVFVSTQTARHHCCSYHISSGHSDFRSVTKGAIIGFIMTLQALQVHCEQYGVFQSIYGYRKEKPPPVYDTNPYIVFQQREKVHKLHTRRMHRRENNLQSL